MKKLIILIILFSSAFLVACENSEDDIDDIDIIDDIDDDTDTNYLTIEDGNLTYNIWTHNGKNMTAEKFAGITFSNPVYVPFTGRLCFDISINDGAYLTSDYYLITRERGTTLTESQIQINTGSNSETLYNCMGYNPTDEIVIVKRNEEDLNPTSSLEVLAWITVDDKLASLRKQTEGGYFTSNDIFSVSLDETPYVDFKYHMEDPERLITSILLEVYYRPFEIVVSSVRINLTEDMYVGDTITIDHIIIDDLPPGTTFDVYYYFSGTDGVDDYTDIQAGYRTVTSSTFKDASRIINSMPSLWGIIKGYTIGETTTTVDFHLVNDGKVTFEDEPIDITLNIYNSSLELIYSYPVSADQSSIEIDNQYLEEHYVLILRTVQDPLSLSLYNIDYKLHDIIDYFSYQDDVVAFRIMEYNVEIISIDIAFKITEDGTPFFTTTLSDFELGPYTYDIVDGPPQVNTLYLDYTVTYIGFNGVETFVVNTYVYYRY